MSEKFYGKYRGLVMNNIDPMQMGRLMVQVPDVTGLMPSTWAMPCVPVAGVQNGMFALPMVGSGVWVEYEQGDPDHPIWVGCFWGSAAEVPALARLTPPAGRMQLVGGVCEPLVVIDYAHTPDALAQVLQALRATVRSREGRLVCVFGCGGDRDPGKRPIMGELAGQQADRVIVTSDNPRTEDPMKILHEVAAGAGPVAERIVDRAQAIGIAIAEAAANDVVLIAGKGHEPYQEVLGQRLPFSDLEQASFALRAWHAGGLKR